MKQGTSIESLILDKLDQALLAARESAPTSFPVYVKEIKNEISLLRVEIKEVKESVQPVVDTFHASKVIGNIIKWTAGTFIAIGAIILSLRQVIRSLI